MAVVLRALTWQSAKPAEQRAFQETALCSQWRLKVRALGREDRVHPALLPFLPPGPHLPVQLVPDLSLSNPATPASPSPNMAPQDRPCFQILLPEGLSQFTPRHTREAQITRPSLGKPAPSLPGRGSLPPLGPSGP